MGIRLRKLGIKISKYLALTLLILTNTPFAYANDIKKAIEQSKSESYYKATVNELKDAVIPEIPNCDPKKENKASGDQVNTEEKQNAKHAIRLPEVSETKTSQEEKALKQTYGEPILVNGQEQIFKKDETNFITYISGDVKTYQDEKGNQFPVNLDLISDQADGKAIFKPSGSPVEVILPEKVTDKQGIKVSKGKDTLELFPKDKTYENATVKDNAILYNNVDEADDVQYTVTDNGVKEEIILNKWSDKHEFKYQFSSQAYDATLQNNQVVVTKKGKKDVLFVLSAPVMIDKKGEKSDAIKMRLKKDKKYYELTIDANKAWLADAKRNYPVRIDPTITVPTENLIDTVTSSVHGTYQGRGYGYVGYITQEMTGVWNAKDVGRTRIYTKVNYDFSKIPKEAKINSASYNLYIDFVNFSDKAKLLQFLESRLNRLDRIDTYILLNQMDMLTNPGNSGLYLIEDLNLLKLFVKGFLREIFWCNLYFPKKPIIIGSGYDLGLITIIKNSEDKQLYQKLAAKNALFFR